MTPRDRHGYLFAPDEVEEYPDSPDRRCTPELLLEFIREQRAAHGRSPSLGDCKARFGLLNALVCGWELKRRRLL